MRIGVVVGATGGIGTACARVLSSAADRVILSGRREAALRQLASQLGSSVSFVKLDLTKQPHHLALAQEIRQLEGELAWLVLASGVPLQRGLPSVTRAEIVETFEANLVGPVTLIRELLGVRWSSPANIVVVGSISASRAVPDRSVYAASKAGLEHLARSLVPELAPLGIRVNVVSPGVINTPFLGGESQALARWVDQRVPLRRAGQPAEVAELVRYLVLDAPGYVAGARMVIDGGAETWT
jgi:NAD(P)-dependent dehydrogenase (short-subunit alcohol dehydrogenase family)